MASVKTNMVLSKAEQLLDAMENRWYIDRRGEGVSWDEELDQAMQNHWLINYIGKNSMVEKFLKAYNSLGIKNPPASITQLKEWNEIFFGALPKKEQVVPVVKDIIKSLKDETSSVSKTRQKEINQEKLIQQEGGFNIVYVNKLTKPVLDKFQEVLKQTITYIRNSPVKDFKKALYGDLYVGTPKDIFELYGIQTSERGAAASYNTTKKNIAFYTKSLNNPDTVSTVIHEFGHKFDYEVHKKHRELLELWESHRCEYIEPQIGFVLPKDTYIPAWTMSSSFSTLLDQDYVLENVEKVQRKKVFWFIGVTDGHLIGLTEEKLKSLQSAKYCSSGYGSTNYDEWFAEMITAITLGLVRPSYKEIADKFLAILNGESIKTSNLKLRLAKLKNLK